MNTDMSTPDSVSTSTPAVVLNGTPTVSPTHLPEVTETPPSTFVPSPTVFYQEMTIEDLLATNGNCSLPCWWGLEPGRTDYHVAVDLLEVFASSLDERGGPRESLVVATIPVPRPSSYKEELSVHMNSDNSNVGVMAVYGYTFTSFPLTEVLRTLGEPADVRFESPLLFPSNYVEYDLYLFYPESGIIVIYSSTTRSSDPEEHLRICDLELVIYSDEYVGLKLWNPEANLTFDDLMGLPLGGVYLPNPISIENISNMDAHLFYQNFLLPNPICLDIDTVKYGQESN
jgi:hypothetical protein